MRIPTEADWPNPHDDPDILWAKEHFFGKNLDEVEKMFVDNALHWQEALVFMPPVPFRYYAYAYINYILSDKSKGDVEGASCFLSLIKGKLEWMDIEKENILAVWKDAWKAIEHIRDNPEWFDWYEPIFGNLENRVDRIKQLAPDYLLE